MLRREEKQTNMFAIRINTLSRTQRINRDRLEFHLNVKDVWILFVTREKAKYFYVTEFYNGI